MSEKEGKTLPERLAESNSGNNSVAESVGSCSVKKNIEPFRLQKADISDEIDDIENYDSIEDAWAWSQGRGEVAVQPLYKGIRGLLAKQGERAILKLEDEPSKNVIGQLKEATLEADEDFTAEVVMVPSEDSGEVPKIYLIDLLFWGDNIVEAPFADRRQKMIEFSRKNLIGSGLVEVVEIKWITSITELHEAVRWALSQKRTKAALFKSYDGIYPTKSKSSDWYELRKGRDFLKTSILKQIDETSLLAAAALGFKVEEITDETSKSSIEKEKKSNEKIKASILKADNEKQFVLGVVLEPMEVDQQEDIMIPADIEETAHDYLINHRVVGFRHKDEEDAVVAESYIAPVDFELNGELVKKGSWLLGIKIYNPDTWQMVKDGEINGFSVGGFGVREELE